VIEKADTALCAPLDSYEFISLEASSHAVRPIVEDSEQAKNVVNVFVHEFLDRFVEKTLLYQ
jgi:hypothetical protein